MPLRPQTKAFLAHLTTFTKRKRELIFYLSETSTPLSITDILKLKRVEDQPANRFRVQRDLEDLINLGFVARVDDDCVSPALAAQFGVPKKYILHPMQQAGEELSNP